MRDVDFEFLTSFAKSEAAERTAVMPDEAVSHQLAMMMKVGSSMKRSERRRTWHQDKDKKR